MRDHKRHTSEEIHQALKHGAESRREWMLPLFNAAGSALSAVEESHNRGFQLWQQDCHPILLSSREMVLQRLHYTHYNPVRAGFVEEPQHWTYSSAAAYTQADILCCLTFGYLICRRNSRRGILSQDFNANANAR